MGGLRDSRREFVRFSPIHQIAFKLSSTRLHGTFFPVPKSLQVYDTMLVAEIAPVIRSVNHTSAKACVAPL